MPKKNRAASPVAKLGALVLVLAAALSQALGHGGAQPSSPRPEPATETPAGAASAHASIPGGWQRWDESAAPEYVLEVGPAQIRADVAEGDVSYSGLDAEGRPGLVAASLTHETRASAKERGRRDIDVDPVGWPGENPKVTITTPDGGTYRGRFWNRSHLLADSLGGDPTTENLVTGTRMQNAGGNDDKGGMAYGEQIARDWLDTHTTGSLYYSALPLYVGGEPIPRAVLVDMRSSDGTIDEELLVYNAAKGFDIDYETGDVKAV